MSDIVRARELLARLERLEAQLAEIHICLPCKGHGYTVFDLFDRPIELSVCECCKGKGIVLGQVPE